MQASFACAPHPHGNGLLKLKLQSLSHTNTNTNNNNNLVPSFTSHTPNTLPTLFAATKSSSNLTLPSKLQPQTLLSPPTLVPTPRSPRIFNPKVGQLRCGISSNGYGSNGKRSLREWAELCGEALSTAFPLWVTLGCVLGLLRPNSFKWVTPRLNIVGLTIIMLGMGMTLTLDDLRGALAMPKQVLSGFVLQYSVSMSTQQVLLPNMFPVQLKQYPCFVAHLSPNFL